MTWNCPQCGKSLPLEKKHFKRQITCLCGFIAKTWDSGLEAHLAPPPPVPGPGVELAAIFKELGIAPTKSCGCTAKAAQMDAWGIEGCAVHRDEILAWMIEAYDATRLTEWLSAGAAALWQGKPKTIAGILDEAVRRAAQRLYGGPVVRNFIYHIGPFAGNGVWQRNVQQILKRAHLFNGKRVVSIITSPNFDPPEMVKDAFGPGFDFLEVPNDPALREVVSFHPLMERVASTAQNEITFFAHAKGVTHGPEKTVHRWTDIQYETCLDYVPLVERLLQIFPIVGSFKKTAGKFFWGKSKSPWHYSGTFYWLRNSQTFNRDWRTIDQYWWGTESWPGLMFKKGGTLFYEKADFDLYEAATMAEVEREYATWKEAHHALQSL